jgi:two-component system sensor histidine kinase DegS
LYRIIQESLANIARHSEAKKVILELRFKEDTVQIQVRDDGIGFEISDQSSGLGLRSMRERTELINGEMLINSSQGKGTLIKVTAPVVIKK